ncbi:MAG: hypothetical protein RJA70_4114 [Pseudomonadota bacterium]|jgi:uncharacterized protein YaeQ
MASQAVVYKVDLNISDVDRGVYEQVDFRIACHPSETADRLVTRILAYALLFEEGLEFGKGLSDADEPALATYTLTGELVHWVDVGAPGAERIHAAAKKANTVSIVCHKPEEALVREMTKRKIHHADLVQVLMLEPAFVAQLATWLTRNSVWSVVHSDGDLSVTLDAHDLASVVRRVPLPQ